MIFVSNAPNDKPSISTSLQCNQCKVFVRNHSSRFTPIDQFRFIVARNSTALSFHRKSSALDCPSGWRWSRYTFSFIVFGRADMSAQSLSQTTDLLCDFHYLLSTRPSGGSLQRTDAEFWLGCHRESLRHIQGFSRSDWSQRKPAKSLTLHRAIWENCGMSIRTENASFLAMASLPGSLRLIERLLK